MAEMTAEMDQMQVPDGGVASFMMSDEDIASLEREEDQQLAEEVYGGEGISQFTDMAAQMAGLGRFGDDVIVHAQTGELVIPKKILDDNPEIKQMVFEQLMAQGVEDPEQYVVGSGSASINPETGLAEYGFGSFFKPIRRVVSSVAKGVKNVASKVVKVAKKVAPIVLPIAMTLAFPALGAYGAALGSGIGTLIQGGSFKDALKSAAISGVTAGAFKGFENVAAGGTFSEGFTGAFSAPGARFAQVGGQLKSGFSGDGFNFGQDFLGGTPKGQTTTGPETGGTTPESQYTADTDPFYTSKNVPTDTTQIVEQSTSPGLPDPSLDDRTLLQKTKDFLLPSDPTGADLAAKQAEFSKSYAEGLTQINPNLGAAEAKAAADAVAQQQITMESIQPGIIGKYGPLAATGLGAMYLTGGFDTPEPTPEEDSPLGVKRGPTGVELFQADPGKYTVDVATPAPITYSAPATQYGSYYNFYNPLTPALPLSRPTEGSPFYRPPVQTAAQGGEIFPRRTGGIMPDEGIPGKDSVRAMLMPGEFVMTTDAVKGMGDGNLRRGIQDMYGVMANLERKGRMA